MLNYADTFLDVLEVTTITGAQLIEFAFHDPLYLHTLNTPTRRIVEVTADSFKSSGNNDDMMLWGFFRQI